MKRIVVVVTLLLIIMATNSIAQHTHHDMKGMNMKGMDMGEKKAAKKTTKKKPAKSSHAQSSTHNHNVDSDTTTEMDMEHMSMDDSTMEMSHDVSANEHKLGDMSHSLSTNLLMNRNGSGTSWNADASPMYMNMKHTKKWMYMLHGAFFIRYNKQDLGNKGHRGNERWDAPNMMMAMGQRKVGKNGLFHFNTMFSLDAVFTGQRGYPLLFQTGESAHGQPLVDRQHPHDLFAELSVSYAHAFSKQSDAYVYLGYPGEPALGATTFMHRPSGWDNPDAPLSHHWVDATHITFGVATIGYRYGKFKAEGSIFTGREPNENRYDFDKPRFDSRSARLWFNPNSNWSLQASHGFIKSPEEFHADEDVYRSTASASYSKVMAHETFFNATGLWGMNKQKQHDGEHAALLEASMRIVRLVMYGRYEWVQKSVEELALDETVFGNDKRFVVNAFTLGAAYDVLRAKNVRTSLGIQASLYHADEQLDLLYGKNPGAMEAYLRFYPSLMQH
jgi:hypothetical protein